MWLMWICSDFVGSPCTRTACGSAGPSLGRGDTRWSLERSKSHGIVFRINDVVICMCIQKESSNHIHILVW